MSPRTRPSGLVYALAALCVAAIVTAVLVVGPASGSQASVSRTATAAEGVVQSTVSGSGNLQPVTQLDLGFRTSGTVTHIYVTQGQQVTAGALLASLDPQSAEVTLEQAKATLQSAEANLVKEEETNGEGSAASGAGTGGAAASAASLRGARAGTATVTAPSPASPAAGASTAATTTPASTAPATTTPATPTTTPPPATTTTPVAPPGTGGERRSASTTTTTTTQPEKTAEREKAKETISTATREANLASARAAVRSDTLTVRSDEQAVQDTKLYAPQSGTIASLNGQVGEVVSGSGTTRASSGSSGSGSSSTGATGTGATGRSSALGASSASSSAASTGSSSSSSAFAVLTDLSSMQLVVPLSESEISNVKVGQIATVTVEALEGRKLAAHVSEVAILSTSNSGVVSYDVTFLLDQMEPALKPGMSATAEVVVKQAEGVNVPTSAISGGSVTVRRGGTDVRRRVVTGLAGNSSTIILSGLKAGETIVLPAARTTSSSSGSSLSSRLGRLAGGGGLGGALGGAGGAGAFFRGGGG
jgi:multidrug efflux pump subunit AcrA (membrane-fusion protein)